MPLWDKLKQELDRAGKAAQGAIDEGKTRLEAFRARQRADKAAEALGYAVFRAQQSGGQLDATTLASLTATLAEHDAEAKRLEDQAGGRVEKDPEDDRPGASTSTASGSSGSTGSASASSGPSAGASAGGTPGGSTGGASAGASSTGPTS